MSVFFRAAARMAARGVARARFATRARPASATSTSAAGKKPPPGRYTAAARSALLTTWRSASGSVRRLWLEVVGFFFLAFAVIGASAGWREYQTWQAGTQGSGRVLLAAAFVLMFLWFGVSSIRRARRK